MTTGKKWLALIALGCIGLLAVGFYQAIPTAQAQTSAAGNVTKIELIMNEFSFQVAGQPAGAPLALKAGQKYALVIKDAGRVAHEIMIGKGLVTTSDRPQGYEKHLLDGVSVVIRHSETEEFAATVMGLMEIELETAHEITIEFTLPQSAKGAWEIGCFFSGHYQAGMKLPLVVE